MEKVISGVRSVWDDGGGDAPCVVLLHGWGGERGSMSPIARALAPGCRVINVDFPGFGHSAAPDKTWDVPEYAAWLMAVLDEAGVTRCTLIGHSFGGRVAVVCAATWPERIEKLVLTGVPGLKRSPTLKSRLRSLIYKTLRAAAGILPGGKGLRERLAYRFGSPDYRACAPGFRPTFVKVVNHDLTPYLGRIQAPTLLIWGDGDTASPLTMAKGFEGGIADAGLVVLKGGSHFAYLEQSARFNAVVHAFLSGKA